jgi:Tfp pilus assembly protein PilN
VEAVRDALVTDLDAFKADRDEINGDLAEVNSAFSPADVKLISVSAGGDSLTVRGVAGNVDAVFSCAKKLRASGRFDNVVITSITKSDHEVSFNLQLTKVI